MWACRIEKAPGPDRFTFKFIKKYWDILFGDIVAVDKFFEEHGKLDSSCNSSFISLIPKIKDPLMIGDYRPISLIGCIYKIISLRMKKVMGHCIDVVQSAYIERRNILDGPLMVNKIYSWAKKNKRKILLFKVDFKNAFDSVNWNFLDSNLMHMGFGGKLRIWLRGCLASARSSVLVNGNPTAEFPLSKGVRQGDPLSPFLFIAAMEGLSVAMKLA